MTRRQPHAADALAEPAQRLGADYAPDALARLVDVSDGYPYFLPTFGAAIWNIAPNPVFTLEDADLAIADGSDQLDAGFFPARWERATPHRTRLPARHGRAYPRHHQCRHDQH